MKKGKRGRPPPLKKLHAVDRHWLVHLLLRCKRLAQRWRRRALKQGATKKLHRTLSLIVPKDASGRIIITPRTAPAVAA